MQPGYTGCLVLDEEGRPFAARDIIMPGRKLSSKSEALGGKCDILTRAPGRIEVKCRRKSVKYRDSLEPCDLSGCVMPGLHASGSRTMRKQQARRYVMDARRASGFFNHGYLSPAQDPEWNRVFGLPALRSGQPMSFWISVGSERTARSVR